MDAQLRILKREAESLDSSEAWRDYARALEKFAGLAPPQLRAVLHNKDASEYSGKSGLFMIVPFEQGDGLQELIMRHDLYPLREEGEFYMSQLKEFVEKVEGAWIVAAELANISLQIGGDPGFNDGLDLALRSWLAENARYTISFSQEEKGNLRL